MKLDEFIAELTAIRNAIGGDREVTALVEHKRDLWNTAKVRVEYEGYLNNNEDAAVLIID